jgi:DNA-binding MarR family transcriptional regulator
VGAGPSAKGNISHSLRLLERQGLIVVGRPPGGKAAYVYLTPEGRQKTLNLSGSYE